jgi:hypothetical protein
MKINSVKILNYETKTKKRKVNKHRKAYQKNKTGIKIQK